MREILRLSVFAFLLTVWLPSLSRADPPTISACDASNYVGQTVVVEGVVTVVAKTKQGVTLISSEATTQTNASPPGFRLGQIWREMT